MVIRQDEPACEVAALEDEVVEVLADLQARFRTLLDAAYSARVEGESVTDKWPDLDVALRGFAYASVREVAASIAAYIDAEQEALLAALAPEEIGDDRLVWRADRVTDHADVGGYHAGAESEVLVYVTNDREWRVQMVSNAETVPSYHSARGLLLRHVIAEALITSQPMDPPVRVLEATILDAARASVAFEARP